MKIHIATKIKDGAWGGGNQFLKALRGELVKQDYYLESISGAEAVIFNSYQDLAQLIKYYFTKGRGKIIYRLGPVFHLHRGSKWKLIDWAVILGANLFVDLIVFQSEWSYRQALSLGLNRRKKYVIISNAVDNSIFFKNKDKITSAKINLIYTSWSTNKNKGFAFLEYLDENLDFTKFNLKFIGNSPLAFKNIEMLKPLPSADLAKELRNSDLFISPAKDDACSNAILEALACGLPVVALDSGSNRELIGLAGVSFTDNTTLTAGIETVANNLDFYRSKISTKSISLIAKEYMVAIKNLCVNIDSK